MDNFREETITIRMDVASHRGYCVSAHLPDSLLSRYGPVVVDRVMEIIAEKLADRYIAEHGQTVLAKMDAQALANLSVGRAAAAIAPAINGQTTMLRDGIRWLGNR